MVYVREYFRIEEIPNLGVLADILPSIYRVPVVRKTTILRMPSFENEEIFDFYAKIFLGTWDFDTFDFAGATDSVIQTLDHHFTSKFLWPRNDL